MQKFDTIVLGAGAAGMFAAIEIGRRGRSVLILEHSVAAGEKIRISGGGRCNFTNATTSPENFLSRNPKFATSALTRYGPQDFVRRLGRAGISWEERQHHQYFCCGSAVQIIDMLLNDLRASAVQLWLSCRIDDIQPSNNGFEVQTSRGLVEAQNLVVATGGKSIPKMGATGLGYQVAERFGIPVVETRPGLVPLTFGEKDLNWMRGLAGVGLAAKVSVGRASFEEGVLFTHRGMSGPAILQISNYWREGMEIAVDLAPDLDLLAFLKAERHENGRQLARTALSKRLPERLARHFEALFGESRVLAETSTARLEQLARAVSGMVLLPLGTEGYRTAEVTLGGVDTAALDSRTMECKAVKGLYFIGEVVDMTGWLGGYNFQWAWSSGWAAGQVA